MRCDLADCANDRTSTYAVTSADNGNRYIARRARGLHARGTCAATPRGATSNPTARRSTAVPRRRRRPPRRRRRPTPTPTPVKTPTPTPTPVEDADAHAATPARPPTVTPTPASGTGGVGGTVGGGDARRRRTPDRRACSRRRSRRPRPATATRARRAGSSARPRRSKPKMIKPYPVVRISGRLTTNGANIDVLSVKAPKGAKITVTCSGKGCPRQVRRHAPPRSSASRSSRRCCPPASSSAITISKPGYITKVTTIPIRKGKAPLRSDQCQMPGDEEAHSAARSKPSNDEGPAERRAFERARSPLACCESRGNDTPPGGGAVRNRRIATVSDLTPFVRSAVVIDYGLSRTCVDEAHTNDRK